MSTYPNDQCCSGRTSKAYVEMVRKGELPNPKVKSFEALKDGCADPFFTVKVAIFNSVARKVTPFLTAYQTEKPMLPFLSEDMFKLMKGKHKHILKAYMFIFVLSIAIKPHSILAFKCLITF